MLLCQTNWPHKWYYVKRIDHVSDIMSKPHIIFTKNVIIFFSHAVEKEKIRKFELETFFWDYLQVKFVSLNIYKIKQKVLPNWFSYFAQAFVYLSQTHLVTHYQVRFTKYKGLQLVNCREFFLMLYFNINF